jgi:hypothetical protein
MDATRRCWSGDRWCATVCRVSESPYRAPSPVESDPYLVAWARQRRVDRRLITLVSGAAIGYLLLIAFLSLRCGWPAQTMFWSNMVLALLARQAVLKKRSQYNCPHCAKPFLSEEDKKRSLGRRWKLQCVHCGILFGTPRSACSLSSERVEDPVVPKIRVAESGDAVSGVDEHERIEADEDAARHDDPPSTRTRSKLHV